MDVLGTFMGEELKGGDDSQKNLQDSNAPNSTPFARFFLHPDFKHDMGVSKNRGTPKWGLYIVENLFKMDDLGEALFSETSICMIVQQKLRIWLLIDATIDRNFSWEDEQRRKEADPKEIE